MDLQKVDLKHQSVAFMNQEAIVKPLENLNQINLCESKSFGRQSNFENLNKKQKRNPKVFKYGFPIISGNGKIYIELVKRIDPQNFLGYKSQDCIKKANADRFTNKETLTRVG